MKATKSPLKAGVLEDLDPNSLDDNGRWEHIGYLVEFSDQQGRLWSQEERKKFLQTKFAGQEHLHLLTHSAYMISVPPFQWGCGIW